MRRGIGLGHLAQAVAGGRPRHPFPRRAAEARNRGCRSKWARDIEKHTAYVALGFEVVRLTSAHIRPTGSAAVTLMGGALRRRGWSPPR